MPTFNVFACAGLPAPAEPAASNENPTSRTRTFVIELLR
jgi:hypothetical protein